MRTFTFKPVKANQNAETKFQLEMVYRNDGNYYRRTPIDNLDEFELEQLVTKASAALEERRREPVNLSDRTDW